MNPGPIDVRKAGDNSGDAALADRALNKLHLANPLILTRDGADALACPFGADQYPGRGMVPGAILPDMKMPRLEGSRLMEKSHAEAEE